MRVEIKLRSLSTSKGFMRNGDIVDLPDEEVAKIIKVRPQAVDILPELPVEKLKSRTEKSASKAEGEACQLRLKKIGALRMTS